MAKVKVKQWGVSRRGHVTIEDRATIGAVVGENLYYSDDTLVPEADLRGGTAAPVGQATPGVITPLRVLWNLILSIPTNIVNLAALAQIGFAARISAAGAWAARVITGQHGRILVTRGDGVGEEGLFLLPDGSSHLLLPDGVSKLIIEDGNPIIDLGPWPTVQNSIPAEDYAVVVAGEQLIVYDSFDIQGDLVLEGELVIL